MSVAHHSKWAIHYSVLAKGITLVNLNMTTDKYQYVLFLLLPIITNFIYTYNTSSLHYTVVYLILVIMNDIIYLNLM